MDSIIPWVKQTINTETEQTLEKTASFNGFPSYQRYVHSQASGEIRLLINKRFEVIARGKNVTYEELQKVIKNWDLSSLY